MRVATLHGVQTGPGGGGVTRVRIITGSTITQAGALAGIGGFAQAAVHPVGVAHITVWTSPTVARNAIAPRNGGRTVRLDLAAGQFDVDAHHRGVDVRGMRRRSSRPRRARCARAMRIASIVDSVP